ncbi:hypothetical protein IIE26_26810 (plasmid) [Cytobacillus oceanisediminis]|uniref:hypothetical protein n=1 Tax=Cytobacillus oceanisediminis TaxID=665099 RepID=UPI0018652F32|nr:hypothetical protein [Cytobacillus oceanisediminis]QOK29981.1 hypothetical protein IIE26_26810 [Cytobacillus oceanisediminis]
MKKKSVLVLAFTFLIIGCVYYFLIYSPYEQAEEFSGFPVPIHAEKIRETKDSTIYKWSRASEENGIPAGYRRAIKENGWEEVGREGALVLYKKGKQKIDLLSTTKQLSIIKGK